MAVIKAKRSVHKKQSVHGTPGSSSLSSRHSAKHRHQKRAARRFRKVIHFFQAKGKTIEDVEFSTAPGYHNISVNFQDKTALNFSIETGFTVETDYSNWKTGNQHILHRWSPIKNKS